MKAHEHDSSAQSAQSASNTQPATLLDEFSAWLNGTSHHDEAATAAFMRYLSLMPSDKLPRVNQVGSVLGLTHPSGSLQLRNVPYALQGAFQTFIATKRVVERPSASTQPDALPPASYL